MTDNITPEIVKERAYQARVSVNKLMKRAKVSNSTLWRWQNEGADPHPITIAKIVDALEAFEAEFEVERTL